MVFLFLVVLIILMLIIFSKITIEIAEFEYQSNLPKGKRMKYQIIYRLYIASKIPLVKIELNEKWLKKTSAKIKKRLEKLDVTDIKKDKDIHNKTMQFINNAKIKKLNLNMEIGTENVVVTSFIIAFVSIIISYIIQKRMDEYQNQRFVIKPIYYNQNLLNIYFNGIFEIKMIHIIRTICMLNKKEGVKKYERTSNRRAYGYSYE